MSFLTLVCSKRKRGNSELIGRLALREAKTLGVSGELIHLGDFSILECEGCMRCVFRNEPCKLGDDIYRLLDKLSQASSLLLISPTYVLSIPGIVKLLIDRYLLMYPYYKTIWGHSAASIGVAGLPRWEQFQLPLLNLLLLSLGFRIYNSFMVYGAGPGEVLLDNSTVDKIKNTVKGLCSDRSLGTYESTISEHCPVCFSKIFERIGPGRFRCPVCLSVAEEKKEGLYFSAEDLNNHRFTPDNVRAHFEDWILPTKSNFRKKLPDIVRVMKQLGI